MDSVAVKNSPNNVHVIYVAAADGSIKKLSHDAVSGTTCLVEVLRPFAPGRAVPVHSMKVVSTMRALYVAAENSVMRIPAQRCRRFSTERQCLNAMDPYCGWHAQKKACVATPNGNPRAAYFQQEPLQCPVLTDPVSVYRFGRCNRS